MGNMCDDLLKHVQKYTEVKYIKQILILYKFNERESRYLLWSPLFRLNSLNSLRQAVFK